MKIKDERILTVFKSHRKETVVVFAVLLLLVFILLLWIIISLMLSAFKIEKIVVVSNNIPYSESELFEICEIQKKDKLFGIDLSEVEKKLLNNIGYIHSVKVRRGFPNSLKIIAECDEGRYYINISGEYYVLSEDLRVLEEADSFDLRAENLIKLDIPEVKRITVGQYIEYKEGQGLESYIGDSLVELTSSELGSNINAINIENKFEMYFIYERKYKIYLGESKDITTKANVVKKVLNDPTFENDKTAIIDVSNPKKLSVVFDNSLDFDAILD